MISGLPESRPVAKVERTEGHELDTEGHKFLNVWGGGAIHQKILSDLFAQPKATQLKTLGLL